MKLIEALDILLEHDLINEDEIKIREATYDEYMKAFKLVSENEVNEFYKHAPEAQRRMLQKQIEASVKIIWNMLLHKYTVTGEEILATLPNADDSTYISMAYVPPHARGNWSSIKVLKQCIADSPKGVSLHTNKNNKRVIKLVQYFGFKQYPSTHPNELYFANKPGIGGHEWVTANNVPDTD